MEKQPVKFPEPRIISSGAMMIVGLKKRYSNETSAQIPNQWQAFLPYIGNIDNQVGNVAFGVMCNGDDQGNIDYLTGVEVSQSAETTGELDILQLSPQSYAVFQHDGHVFEIGRTWKFIFSEWLVNTDRELVQAPQFERYGENFDPQAGVGDIEIWIPITDTP